ncbi:MAG: hypothetical protein NWE76_02475 [Candidatus Bathyarchaeota archaeon]|nr:hypothetical protein [Candidatus Bathyarchaeota archaeon]
MSEELQTSVEAGEEQQVVPLEEMKVAILAGILPDGKFLFQTHGTQQGLIEYIGVHAYIGMRIQSLADEVVFRGDRITHEVGKAVGLLNKKVDDLIASLGAAPAEAEPAPEETPTEG